MELQPDAGGSLDGPSIPLESFSTLSFSGPAGIHAARLWEGIERLDRIVSIGAEQRVAEFLRETSSPLLRAFAAVQAGTESIASSAFVAVLQRALKRFPDTTIETLLEIGDQAAAVRDRRSATAAVLIFHELRRSEPSLAIALLRRIERQGRISSTAVSVLATGTQEDFELYLHRAEVSRKPVQEKLVRALPYFPADRLYQVMDFAVSRDPHRYLFGLYCVQQYALYLNSPIGAHEVEDSRRLFAKSMRLIDILNGDNTDALLGYGERFRSPAVRRARALTRELIEGLG